MLIGAPNQRVNGVPYAGAVYAYHLRNLDWQATGALVGSDSHSGDAFGTSLDTEGRFALVGAAWKQELAISKAGAVYVFKLAGTHWSESHRVFPAASPISVWFGVSVALSGRRGAASAPLASPPGANQAGIVHAFPLLP